MNDNFTTEYFGIGILNGKTPENLGVLWRSAQNLGASYIFTIGNRYAKQACDTHKATGAMPYFHYESFEDFYNKEILKQVWIYSIFITLIMFLLAIFYPNLPDGIFIGVSPAFGEFAYRKFLKKEQKHNLNHCISFLQIIKALVHF